MLPVLIGVGGLAIDVGYWFAHKRHLQTQADAGVLAAALQYSVPCSATPVIKAATDYSSIGLDQGAGYVPQTISGQTGYNPQIGATPAARLKGKVNAATYWPDRATPNDDTVVAGDPCAAKMVDLKLTETDLPWFLKAATVSFIDAHARVELKKQSIGKQLIPIGLPDVNPKKARAFFIDKSKTPSDPNYIVASTDLEQTGVSGGLQIWTNVTSAPLTPIPVSVNVSADKLGVRVALGDNSTPLVGDFPTVCAISGVTCYDAGASANGLVNIRGWTTGTGTLTSPVDRDVDLLQGTCSDGYYNVLAPDTACQIGARATIDFGAGTFGASNTGKPAGVKVQAFRTDTPGTLYDLNFDTAGANPGTWLVSNAIPLTGDSTGPPARTGDAGPVGIGIKWSTGCNAAGNNCSSTGTLGAQSSFVATEALAGPIKRLNVTEGSGLTDKNSFQKGTTHNLVVTLGLAGNIKVASAVNDPPVTMKFNAGGLTGLVDCDSTLSVPDEFWKGCGPSYTPNTGHDCPFASTPLQCVPVEPGNKVGQIAPGLNHRILGDEKPSQSIAGCTSKNHWSQFATGLPQGDPRIIQVFITPLNAFSGSGSGSVPILDFATFYVTGWQGVGASKNPCQLLPSSDPEHDDPVVNDGEIIGHFINYIDHADPDTGSDVPCDFTSLTPCVTVFTR